MSDLAKKLKEAGYEPFSYSGRGMFGAQCVAVTVPDLQGSMFKLGSSIGIGPSTPRTDNLGHQYVVYWPSEAWSK